MKIRRRRLAMDDTSAMVRAAMEKLREAGGSLVLAKIPSHSEQGKYYSITMGSNNAVYCPCSGFKYRSKCTHMDRFRSEHQPVVYK